MCKLSVLVFILIMWFEFCVVVIGCVVGMLLLLGIFLLLFLLNDGMFCDVFCVCCCLIGIIGCGL